MSLHLKALAVFPKIFFAKNTINTVSVALFDHVFLFGVGVSFTLGK